MRHLLIIVYLCCFNGSLVAVTRRRFGQCIPVSLMLMPLVMYGMQFITGSFKPAYILMAAIALAFIPLAILRKRTIQENYFTLGLLSFLIVSVSIIILDYRHFFTVYDEFSHWGPMVKEMVRLDTWYAVKESRILGHDDYPPFMQLFETMWCCYAGGFSEMAVNYAIHIFSAGLIMPTIAENLSGYLKNPDENRSKRFCQNAVMMILLFAFYLFAGKAFDGGSTFTTIYKDYIMAFLFAYAIILIVHKDALRDPFGYWSLVLAITALLLTKQMGMCYVLVVWFTWLIMRIADRIGGDLAIRKGLLQFIPLVVVPYAVNHIWTSYIHDLGYTGQFDLGKISLEQIPAILKDNYCETAQRQALNKYIHALFERDLFCFPIPVSYVAAFLVALALLYGAYRLRPQMFGKYEMLSIDAAFLCGTAGYALTMGILYLFCYSEGEMLSLASYERYLAPYVYAEFLVIAWIYMEILGEMQCLRIVNMACAFAVMVVVLGVSNLSVFIPKALDGEPNRDYKSIAAMLNQQIQDDDTVWVLSWQNRSTQVILNFYSENYVARYGAYDTLEQDLSDPAILEGVMEQILDCDYLYVMDTNDQFNEYFATYNAGENYEEGTLYRIDHNGDAITMMMMP